MIIQSRKKREHLSKYTYELSNLASEAKVSQFTKVPSTTIVNGGKWS